MSREVADWWRRSGEAELRALLVERDPIGLMRLDPPWPRGEYDAYLAPIFHTLRDGGGSAEVWRTLHEALSDMGLGPARDRERGLADRIVEWWGRSFPAGH